MAYDSEVRIDTKLNTDGIQQGVRAAKDEIRKIENALNSVNTAIIKQEAVVENLRKKYEEAAAQADKIGQETGFEGADFEAAAKGVDKIYNSLQNAKQKLAETKSQSEALNIALANMPVANTEETAENIKKIGESSQNAAANTTSAFDKVKTAMGGIAGVATRIGSAIGVIGRAARSVASAAISAFRKIGSAIGSIASGAGKAAVGIAGFAKGILAIGRHSRTASSGVDRLWRRLTRLVSAALIFNVIRRGLSELSKGIGNVLMANQQFASSWNAIKVNMLTAFAPLWEVIEPAILTFMDLLARFTSMLAQFMATLFGKTYQQAKESAKGFIKQADAVDKLGKAAKKTLAPFDELITLQSESAYQAGAEAGGLDFGAVEPPDFSWIDEFVQKIKELEPDLSYFEGLGDKLAQKLADEMAKIPWDTIQQWLNGKVAALAAFLNGIVGNDAFWTALGNLIKKGIETALLAANTFLTNFHWYDFGARIGELFNAVVANMPLYGQMLGNAIDAALAVANGFIDKFPWSDAGSGLASIFNELIDRLPEIGTTIGKAINGILDTIQSFVADTHWTELGQNLTLGLQNMLDQIPEGKLGETFGGIINGIFTALYSFFDTFDFIAFGTRLGKEINAAIDTIDWDLINKTLELAIHKVLNGITAFFTTVNWQEMGSKLSGLINSMFQGISAGEAGEALASVVNAALNFIKGAINDFDFAENGRILATNINKFISDVNWSDVGKTLSDGFLGVLTFIGEFIRGTDWYEIGKSIKEFVSAIDWGEIISEIARLLGNAFGGLALLLKGALEDVVTNIQKYFSEMIDAAKEQFGDNGAAILLGILAGIGKAILDIGKWLYDNLLVPFINGVKEVFGIHSPSTVMEEIGGFIIDGLLKGITDFKDDVIEFFNGLLTSIQEIFSGIGTWFSERWTDITTSFNEVSSWFSTTFGQAWTGIQNVFKDIGTWFGNRWTDIVDAFSVASSWFGTTFDSAWKGITGIFEGAGTWFGDIWKNIQDAFGNITDWFRDKFSEAWQAVKDVFSAGGQIFEGIKDGILDGLKFVINGLIDGINTVIKIPFDGINSALNAIKNVNIAGFTPFSWLPTITIPQIPRLARGGIVDEATVAMLGEKGREAVVPLENNTEWMRPMQEVRDEIAGMKDLLQELIEVTRAGHTIEMDGKPVAKTVTRQQISLSRRNGKTLLPT